MISRPERLALVLGRLWPSSALLAWAAAWALWRGLGSTGGALAAACALTLVAALLHQRPWRRLCVLLGFPLLLSLQGLALPAWIWLLAGVGLWLLYPIRHWRDAPLFLTPPSAFDALAPEPGLQRAVRVLDAGCGSGAGLRAWRRAFPAAQLHGTEASWALALWARWRTPGAQIRCADLWTDDWSTFDLVYLFQRPESMHQALAKARAELRPGSFLLSLDFPLPGVPAQREWPVAPRHRLYLYAAESLN